MSRITQSYIAIIVEGISKPPVEPRVMLEVLVCAYLKGVILRPEKHPIQLVTLRPALARPLFCGGKTTQSAIENLFYQYAAPDNHTRSRQFKPGRNVR